MSNATSNLNKAGRVVVYLEGLPGCGKTSTLKSLSKTHLTYPEILIPGNVKQFHNLQSQTFFQKNDEQKQLRAEMSKTIVIIDRSPLSTLFFNLAKHKIDPNHNPNSVIKWFNKIINSKISEKNCHFILMDIPASLSLKRKRRKINLNDPWANPYTLELIRKMFIKRSKDYASQFIVLDGKVKRFEILSAVRKQILKYEQI